MAQPQPYNRQFNFADQQAQTPSTPLPAQEVDAELNAVKLTIDQTLANLAKIQRDDGALKNGIVSQDSLSPSLSIGFTLRGEWQSGVNYFLSDGVTVGSKFFRATASALSNPGNAPEQPGAPWVIVANFTAATEDAEAARDAALAAQSAAEAAKTDAEAAASTAAADAASTAADAAATAADRVQTSADAASTAADAAATAADRVQTSADAASTAADAVSTAADAAAAQAAATFSHSTSYPAGSVGKKLRASVSVTDAPFNAVGDGVADDTAAIQAALATGKAVYFPKGVYKTTATLSGVAGNAIFGEGPNSSKIAAAHGGRVLSFEDVDTFGVFIRDIEIGGNGTGSGLYVATTLELSAHMHLENVRFYNLEWGTYGVDTYALFDSYLEKVDFLHCSTWGFSLAGSGNTLVGCTFRLCGWGIYQEAMTGVSVGGANLFGGTFVGNTYDVVIGGSTVRPLTFNSVWFEQTATLTMGALVGSEVSFLSMAFNNCLFQPAATASGNGVIAVFDYKGSVTFSGCIVASDLYALASLPSATDVGLSDTNVTFARRGCYVLNGGTAAPLYDFTIGPSTRLFAPLAIGTDTPAASALLDLSSTTKGFLPPRMTSTQRDAITPADALVIYNTTTSKLQVRAGGSWVDLH